MIFIRLIALTLLVITLTHSSSYADVKIIQYEDKDIRVSLIKAYVEERKISDIDFSTLNVELAVEPLNPTRIIKPRTSMVYGFDSTAQKPKSIPVGFQVSDNYGNDMMVTSVTPEYIGHYTKRPGIRAGDKIKMALKVNEVPLPNTEYISLMISKDNFNTAKDVELHIPAGLIK